MAKRVNAQGHHVRWWMGMAVERVFVSRALPTRPLLASLLTARPTGLSFENTRVSPPGRTQRPKLGPLRNHVVRRGRHRHHALGLSVGQRCKGGANAFASNAPTRAYGGSPHGPCDDVEPQGTILRRSWHGAAIDLWTTMRRAGDVPGTSWGHCCRDTGVVLYSAFP